MISALMTGALSGRDVAMGVFEGPLYVGEVGPSGDLACVVVVLVCCSDEDSACVLVVTCGCFVVAETSVVGAEHT